MKYTNALKFRKDMADNLPTPEEIKTLSSAVLLEKLNVVQNAEKSLRVEFWKKQQEELQPPWVANTTQVLNSNDGLMWTFVRFLANNQVLIKQGGEFDVANLPELSEVFP